MKNLLLVALLCVGFAWSAENKANEYPKHWTAEDIKFYEELDSFSDIDENIEYCNHGSGYSLHTCQFLKAFKQTLLYNNAKNKTKAKQSYKEMCYWLTRMGKYEVENLSTYAFHNEKGQFRDPVGMPSEVQWQIKQCAKVK